VPGRSDAGCSVNVRSDIAFLGDVRRPGVDPYAHADRSGRKHLLRFGGSGKRGRRSGERDEEGVALRIHLDPVVADERLTKRATMLGQRVCVGIGTKLLQKPRRPLDVGEDKSDCSGRKLARHAAYLSATNHKARRSPRECSHAAATVSQPDDGTSLQGLQSRLMGLEASDLPHTGAGEHVRYDLGLVATVSRVHLQRESDVGVSREVRQRRRRRPPVKTSPG